MLSKGNSDYLGKTCFEEPRPSPDSLLNMVKCIPTYLSNKTHENFYILVPILRHIVLDNVKFRTLFPKLVFYSD